MLKHPKVIERKLNFYFRNSDLDLDHIDLGSNPKLRLDVDTHTPSLVPVGQSKLKLLGGTEFLFLVAVTLTLITYTWVAIPSCVLM